MSDLAEFLRARIAEDEEVARAVLARASVYDDHEVSWKWLRVVGDSSMWEPTTYDPARVLAECEAKRRIMEGCLDQARALLAAQMSGAREDLTPARAASAALWAAVAYLALPYSDHSDYRQEWRP